MWSGKIDACAYLSNAVVCVRQLSDRVFLVQPGRHEFRLGRVKVREGEQTYNGHLVWLKCVPLANKFEVWNEVSVATFRHDNLIVPEALLLDGRNMYVCRLCVTDCV